MDLSLNWLKEFVDTYVDSYYLETFGTIKNKSYFEVKPKDITEELKGKYYEIIYEKEKKDNRIIDFKKDITILYVVAVLGVNIDLQKYKEGADISYFEEKVSKIVESKKDVISVDRKQIKALSRQVKKHEDLIVKYIDSLSNPNFKLKFEEYSGEEGKFHVKLKAYLKEMNSYKQCHIYKL